MNLVINSIDYQGSVVDGPGIRTVLYVQGCKRRCEDCHNPSTWDMNKGRDKDINDLINELNTKCINKKLTITGGEPLLQYEHVLALVKQLPHFNIALYTGFELEEVPDEILKHLDYIKVGPYQKDKRTTTTPYIGSTNQKFIELKLKHNKNRGNMSEINQL